ncbi:hypothetical protein EDC30_11234 [Paucimonas lemoignei]|uniref:Lipoprotein n=1 Tax=Paucimonas lemoignei TaxID=29443 RepID=A0A4R3HSA0_PAULE|nr:hypothetical protein [Paucimonas lemoignei]TCS34704.1 hypothetical protein EDC30_11234 [Paucimonas lemoignei]
MENRVPQILAVRNMKRGGRLVLAATLLLFLGACDRPGTPPSPIDPAKPKMKAKAVQPVQDVHTAIFNYARPAKKTSSAIEPPPEIGTRGRLQV